MKANPQHRVQALQLAARDLSLLGRHGETGKPLAGALQLSPKMTQYYQTLRRAGLPYSAQLLSLARNVEVGWPVPAAPQLRVARLSAPRGTPVWSARGLLNDAEASELVKAFQKNALRSASEAVPKICIARASKLCGQLQREKLLTAADMDAAPAPGGGTSNVCVRSADLAKRLKWSESSYVLPGHLELLDTLEARLEEAFGLRRDRALSSQLLRYEGGTDYQAHTDCTLALKPGDRLHTVVVYLNTLPEAAGGATYFPALNISTQPEAGAAVVFSGQDPATGFCDSRSMHTALPVLQGEKYVLQKWYMPTKYPGDTAAPKGEDYVLCDMSGSCRSYFHWKASKTEL